jgi:fatty acid desaturase
VKLSTRSIRRPIAARLRKGHWARIGRWLGRARWWDRLFLSPNRVNYHLEHHLVVTIPHYNLPRFHRMLHDRGLLDDALISPSYVAVLREVSAKAA